MRRSQSSSDHAEAVSRRLATLSAELAAVRAEPSGEGWDGSTHTRVRDRADDVSPPPPVALPVVLPLPGRHASRRMVIGGLRLGPVHLAVVAVVAALAVGLAAWWAVRDQATIVPAHGHRPQVTSARRAAGAGAERDPQRDAAGDSAGATSSSSTSRARYADPGIAVLPPGSRVVDALEAAGGARAGVDLTGLNLARLVVDGEQILVGVAPAAGVAGGLGTPPPEGTTLVNLNTADQATLETLPGVGPVTAESILAWRTDNGGFTAVDELLEVDGIGEATLEDLAPLVTL